MVLKGLVLLYCLAVASAGVIGTAHAPLPAVSTVYSPPVVTKTVTPIVTKTIITPGAPVYETFLTTHETKHKSSDGSQHSSFSKTLDTAYSKVDKFESRSLPQVYGVPSFGPVTSYGETTLLGNRVFPVIKSVSPTVVYPAPGPIYSNTIYRQDISYGETTPLNRRLIPVVTKTISHPVFYTAPVLTKTITPVLKKTEIVTPVLHAHVTPVLKTVSPVVTKTVTTPLVYSPVVAKTITPVVKNIVSPAAIVHTTPVKTAIAYSDAPVVSHISFSGLGASYAW